MSKLHYFVLHVNTGGAVVITLYWVRHDYKAPDAGSVHSVDDGIHLQL